MVLSVFQKQRNTIGQKHVLLRACLQAHSQSGMYCIGNNL